MMELSGVIIVLALVSCVACTPYGYGVKGGAAAKAEANAASSAFGGAPPLGIPLSIPSGGGFSGSFSKSSSSSSASSSSSSSSISSSYSFGGTGALGVAGNSIPSSLHGSPSTHGFGASGSLSQAGASAIAGSSALSHNVGGLPVPCAGKNCNTAGNSNKCTSNECGSSDHQHNIISINDNKSCLSGQCQPSSGTNEYGSDVQTANSPSIYQQMDLNDFEVNIGGKSKSSNNLGHGHTSGFDSNGSQNPCSYGKCGTNSNAATAPSADPSGNAASTNLQQPATHLTTPNIEPACSTHSCISALTGSNNGKPSSYNVPILGGNPDGASTNYNSNIQPTGPLYNSPSEVPLKSAVTPKIPSYSDGIYSPPLPTRLSGSLGCNEPNCNSLNNPSYQSQSRPSCNTPNCDVHPIPSGLSSPNGFIKPVTVPSSSQLASFGVAGTDKNTGQNEYSGHTNGFLKPNPNYLTSNAGSLNVVRHPGSSEIPRTNVMSTNQNTQGYTGGFGAPTGSINTEHKPNTGSEVSGASTHGLNNSLKPGLSVLPSSQSIPSYTGGFGGSAGSFDTNTGAHFQSKPTNENPSSALNGAPHNTGIPAGPAHTSLGLSKPGSSLHFGHNTPSHTGGFGRPTGSSDVHSDVGSHDTAHTVGGAPVTGLHGSFGIKPESVAVWSNEKNPIYTGGFGGSAGTFETGSKIGTHVKAKPTHDETSSGPHIAQTSGDHTGSGTAAISGTGSSNNHDVHKPSESLVPPNTGFSNTGYFAGANNVLQPGLVKPVDEKTKLPPYLGGFGGPSGVLRPNEYSISTNTPITPLGHTSCSTGNCGSINLPSEKEHSLLAHASAAANAKAVAYSGSFGGPPGFLKPFDDGKPFNNGHDEHTGKIKTGHDKPASGVYTEYGNAPSGDSVNAANAGANANAATASSNAFSANQGISSTGCNSGCGSNHSKHDGSYASSIGSSKTDTLEGHDSPVGSLASANSVAGAGVGSFGAGRSLASSSASAHASAGAAVKGGYGRR